MRLQRLSTAFLNEAGSVLQTLMDAASKQFAIELLLPWVQRIALLEPGRAKLTLTLNLTLTPTPTPTLTLTLTLTLSRCTRPSRSG